MMRDEKIYNVPIEKPKGRTGRFFASSPKPLDYLGLYVPKHEQAFMTARVWLDGFDLYGGPVPIAKACRISPYPFAHGRFQTSIRIQLRRSKLAFASPYRLSILRGRRVRTLYRKGGWPESVVIFARDTP